MVRKVSQKFYVNKNGPGLSQRVNIFKHSDNIVKNKISLFNPVHCDGAIRKTVRKLDPVDTHQADLGGGHKSPGGYLVTARECTPVL